jgi:hypothetical protein
MLDLLRAASGLTIAVRPDVLRGLTSLSHLLSNSRLSRATGLVVRSIDRLRLR